GGRYVDLPPRLSLHRAAFCGGVRRDHRRGLEMAESNQRITAASSDGQISTELSSRRTGMSFQRTRMSADRTLMSVIRTSLSLIGFGFTIYQVFQKLYKADVLKRSNAPRRFGEALVVLGIGMLVLGIGYQFAFMSELRRQREQMKLDGLIQPDSPFPV